MAGLACSEAMSLKASGGARAAAEGLGHPASFSCSHEEVTSCKSDTSWDLGRVFPAVGFPPAAGLVLPVEGPAHGCRPGLRNCFREAPLSHSVVTDAQKEPSPFPVA